MPNRFVVVGGDAAGMSAASKAKRDAPDAEVVVFERGDWVSYGACGLPYYVKGEIADLEDLVVVDPETFAERGIDLRRNREVVAIDRDERTVTVEGPDRRREERYDDLLVATGGRGELPNVRGTDLDGVFTLRSLEAGRALRSYIVPDAEPVAPEMNSGVAVDGGDGAEMRTYLAETGPEAVAVVGANKIGVELAEAFAARGFGVHLFESGSHVLPTFGADAASVVADHLREQGVELRLDTPVEGFRGGDGRVEAVETAAGSVAVEAVVADLGVEPNVELAAEAGVELGPTGAIATDEYGRTNDPHVYAAGDCAEKRHLLADEPVHWPYALAANRAGRAVGRTVAGRTTPVGGVVGTGVMKAFDLQVARTGLLDDEARAAGFTPVSTTVTTITRAHYYSGWSRIVVHLTADRDTERLLGASMVGEEGAAHRINAVATALHAEMTVGELGALDFGYAPPFGPVWDPVLGAAKVLGDELE